MTGEFTFDGTKALNIIKRKIIKTQICSQSIDSVFSMAGIIHKIITFIPGPFEENMILWMEDIISANADGRECIARTNI